MIDTLKLILKSRTTWTVVAAFVIGGVQNVTGFLSPTLATSVNGLLAAIAIYFHINPSQTYK